MNLTTRLLLASLVLFCSAPLAAEEVAGDEIEVDFLNGVYTDLDSGIQPVQRGALVIHISSPSHQLTVHGNRLRLADRGDGTVAAVLAVDFEGEGEIVADIESGGIRRPLEDFVAAPRQTVVVAGTARLERAEGGYLMTVVDGPETVDLEIQSDLAGKLVGFCKTFQRLPLIKIDCTGMETALSVVTVPLPEPGEQFVVPAGELTEDEVAYFDRFVSAAAPEPVPTPE